MRTCRCLPGLASAAVIGLGFAACTGAQNTISPSASAALASSTSSGLRSMRHHRKSALFFVVNSSDNRIEVYDPNLSNPSPIAAITEGVVTPYGACLDKSGTLYVVNGVHNTIPEYRKGQSAPYQVISKGLKNPAFCALDGAGNLWVTNTYGHNVTEYPKGSTIQARLSRTELLTRSALPSIGMTTCSC